MNFPNVGEVIQDHYFLEKVIRTSEHSTSFKANHILKNQPMEVEVSTEPSEFFAATRLELLFAPVFVNAPFDVGRLPGDWMYVCREYIHDAKRLSDELAKPRPWFARVEQAIRLRTPQHVIARHIMRSLLAAVGHAHEKQKVVLRDIRPENLLLMYDRSVRLADLCAARKLDTKPDARGHAMYRAPEATFDARSDLYACGVIYAELLQGRRLEKVGPVPPVVAKAIDPDPAKRFANADAFASALL